MRKVTVALAIAAIWGAGLIVAAAVAPFYESRSASSPASSGSANGANGLTTETPAQTRSTSTLVAQNGPGALVLVSLPLLAVGVVAGALRRRHAHGRAGAGPFAWSVAGLLGAFAVLGLMSIGLFIMPIAGLLGFACGAVSARGTTPRGAVPPSTLSGGMSA